MIANPVTFFSSSDMAVVGQNWEMADIDNPRGYLYGEVAYVVAENAHGDRCRLSVKLDGDSYGPECVKAAETLAERLNARLAMGKLPVGFAGWDEDRPAYGSAAYVEYGSDDDLAWEARAAEEEAWA